MCSSESGRDSERLKPEVPRLTEARVKDIVNEEFEKIGADLFKKLIDQKL